jgi:hypothetical protein
MNNEACGTSGFCSMNQQDADEDKVGDACEPIITTTTSTTSSTTTTVPSVTVADPDHVYRSFWLPLPYLLSINSNGFNFSSNCKKPDYDPDDALCDFPIGRITDSYYWDIILVMPGLWRGLTNQDEEIKIIMTCENDDAEDVVATGTFVIESFGF